MYQRQRFKLLQCEQKWKLYLSLQSLPLCLLQVRKITQWSYPYDNQDTQRSTEFWGCTITRFLETSVIMLTGFQAKHSVQNCTMHILLWHITQERHGLISLFLNGIYFVKERTNIQTKVHCQGLLILISSALPVNGSSVMFCWITPGIIESRTICNNPSNCGLLETGQLSINAYSRSKNIGI